MKLDIPRLHAHAATGVLLVCLSVYVAALSPSMYWLDSSEFAAAAFELGVAHPPGHPLAALLGKACALVPLGSVAFRVGLASALMGAFAAALVTLLGAALARRAGEAVGEPDALVEALAGAGAGIGFGFSYAAAFQAVRPEVYALNAALVLCAAWALVRFDGAGDRRWIYLAALAVGLALCNHHLLALTFAAAAILFLVARRPGPRLAHSLALVVLAGAFGLATYVYLPLRAGRHPEVDWGAPSTLTRFFWTVSAKAFQKAMHKADAGAGPAVAFTLLGELGLLAPLSAAGLYLMVRLRRLRRLALLVGVAALLDALTPALIGFDPANPDALGYLEPAVALLATAGAVAPAVFAALARKRRLARAIAAAVSLAVALLAARALPSVRLDRFHDTDRFAGEMIDRAPSRAALVTSYFQTVFALWYLRGVEGRRPDIDYVHRHFLPDPGYREEVLLRAPSLAPILVPHPARALAEMARQRPVLLEYDLDLDGEALPRLRPGGLIDFVVPEPLSDGERSAAEGVARARIEAFGRDVDLDEPQTRRLVLWLDFLDASRDCALGRRAAAMVSIDRARRRLSARDPDLEALAARCLGAP